MVGLDCYKWYQSQTSDDVPASRLGFEGGELGVPHQLEKGTSANEHAGPRRGGLWDPTSVGEEN